MWSGFILTAHKIKKFFHCEGGILIYHKLMNLHYLSLAIAAMKIEEIHSKLP